MADYQEGLITGRRVTAHIPLGGSVIKRYSTTPEVVEAAKVSESTAEEIAKWCGGEVQREPKASDPTDVAVTVFIPTILGVQRADAGWYVVKNIGTGRFSAYTPEAFEEKKFHEVGLRQDGPTPRSPYVTINYKDTAGTTSSRRGEE